MVIESEGQNLSRGEQQLICFARSMLKNSKIVLLDEATSSIDLKTEATIQKCIESEFSNCTMLIIAHRIQTVMECDRIIVMEQGEIVEVGPPQELMRNEGSFFKDVVTKMQAK